MKTVEEIAREAAERLVFVVTDSDPDHSTPHQLRVGDYVDYDFSRLENAEREAAELRGQIAPAVAAAIREALTQCPVPSPVDDERLAKALGEADRTLGLRLHAGCTEALVDLARHVRFLQRILADDVSVAAVREAEKRGYERGLRDASKPLTLTDPDALHASPPE